MAKQWTKAEDEVIKRNYAVYGPHIELWDGRINRSAASIRGRANRLGLKMKEPRKYTKAEWTEHEVDALLRNYPIHGTDMSMWDERIGRDAASVRAKARQLGLTAMYPDPRYNAPWTDREVAALKRNYQEHGAKVGDWDEPIERKRKAITRKARKMGMYRRRGGMSIDEKQAERLVQAWRMIASRIGASKYSLVDDLVTLRERGEL